MIFLPNPFDPDSTGSHPAAVEAAASTYPQSGAAAINPGPTIPYGPNLPAEAHPAPASAGLLDDIPELFYYARKLCAEARQFVPDYPGIYQAMLDPSAPRALESDPVWADEAPLFLRQAG